MVPEDDEVNREELEAFLATAPEGLKGWADEQLARLDAEGAGADAGAGAGRAEGVDGAASSDVVDGAEPDGEDGAADVEDLLSDDDELSPSASPAAAARTPRPAKGRRPSKIQRRTGVSGVNLVLVTLLAAAIVIIIQQMGRAGGPATGSAVPTGHPSVAAGAGPSDISQMNEAEPVDSEKESRLKSEAEADPQNLSARQELGVMYLKAALYQDSITWLQQILDVQPDNLDALLTIGVSEYQSNQYEQAERHWVRASELAPDVAEPWYNLGFLYMAQSPPDSARATECWNKVIEINPDSELAAAVRNHESRMPSPSPSTVSGG